MSSKTIYIAASSSPEGIAAYREMRDILVARGHKVAHDWTSKPESNRAIGVTDVMMSREDRVKEARGNIFGLLKADILIYLAPKQKSEGSAYELGFQNGFEAALVSAPLGLFTTTIVVGDAACLFADLSEFHADSMTEAADIVDRALCRPQGFGQKPFRCE
jgi:hypothetical protein